MIAVCEPQIEIFLVAPHTFGKLSSGNTLYNGSPLSVCLTIFSSLITASLSFSFYFFTRVLFLLHYASLLEVAFALKLFDFCVPLIESTTNIFTEPQ